MKRKRSLGGWCGLGLAVAAVAGGAFAGKRYAEQHMLATVLGSGVHAESMQWHWRQAAGCAEHVEIPLPHATDTHDHALQLYAPKLWFVYDQAALLRKRFILPRVVIEDALISTATDRLLTDEVVDIDFGLGVELGDLVEQPNDTTPDTKSANSVEVSAGNIEAASTYATNGSGLALPWLDQLQALCESVVSNKTIQGRQVSIDADMLSERVQAYFADSRTQAQKLVAEARDLQQQLVNMDNVLRQPQLTEISRRLEQVSEQLIRLKVDIVHSGKSLDDEHSRIRSALLIEKTQLLRQADEYAAPAADAVADAILTHMVKDQLRQPARAVVLMADLMRKPLTATASMRGQQLRFLEEQQPEFAARSARISGKAEIGDHAWPFKAEGSFELMASPSAQKSDTGTDSVADSEQTDGHSQWHMTIDAQPDAWQLDGQCPSIDGPCTVTLASSSTTGLSMSCEVQQATISGKGQIGLRELIGTAGATVRNGEGFAESYRSPMLLRRLMTDALVVDDQTPELIEFEAAELEQLTNKQLSQAAVEWLSARIQQVATVAMADIYRQAAMQLDKLILSKLTEHKGLVATLRNDAEQYVGSQQDELRRIQASVNSLIEQRQANYYFARQPSGAPR